MDYFFVFSPTSLFSVLALTALGFYIGSFSNDIIPQWELNFNIKIFFLFLSLVFITSSSLFIDEKNMFKSDDEIGWFFDNLKRLQNDLSKFKMEFNLLYHASYF